jgi:ADP-ribose pyrophosphatase YjhB (NUDIX family)
MISSGDPLCQARTSNEDVATKCCVANHNNEDIRKHTPEICNQERTKDISAWTFPMDFSFIKSVAGRAGFFTAGEDSGLPANNSEGEREESVEPSKATTWYTNITQEERESVSRRVNVEAATLVAARETRVKERLAVNERTGTQVRLVAGCVPILRDGRVILIGSRKGNNWVGLPKGGWELDETIEEAAIRECFEEAGLLGILGPNLSSFQVESGKAKTNRQDAEISANDLQENVDEAAARGVNYCELNSLTPLWCTSSNATRNGRELLESGGHTRTHACMTFFPLYVQQVKETWPESSRIRAAFPFSGM